MNLEKLIEQRSAIIAKLEALKTLAETETRAFTSEELEKVKEYKAEVERINGTIKAFEETRSFEEQPKEKVKEKTLLEEIRSLDSTKELEIGLNEVRANTNIHAMNAGSNAKDLHTTAKKTFADYILDKLVYTSPLYAALRKERITSSNHQIPVQANRLTKFVPMAELASYTKQAATFEPINLEPHKFGTMISFSEELLEDHGYNIEGELLRQLMDAYSITIDELVVKGNGTVNGLESFGVLHNDLDPADGSKGVVLPNNGAVTIEHILDIYHRLPIPYRANAVWVMSDSMASKLSKLQDGDGRPLLMESYNQTPFGRSYTLLGHRVIVSEFVSNTHTVQDSKTIYFGDLSRALIVGERRSLKLTKSTEYGFIRDEIAIKASMRLDIKKAIGEAIVIGVVSN